MANTPSAIKRIRQTTKRTETNRHDKSRLRTQIKKLEQAIDQKDTAAAGELLPSTLGAVDRSVQKGVIKKKTGSRIKSRLTLRVNALGAGGPTPS